MLKQITEWNTVQKLWMIGEDSLLSPLFKPYSGRWPTSGMMRDGVVYELPMQEHRTTVTEFSLSPTQVLGTPTTATSGRSPEFRKGSNPNPVEFVEDLIADGLLPTPNTMEHREIKTPEQIAELKLRSPGGYRNLREVVVNELPDSDLLRTPSVVDSTGGAISESQARERGRMVKVADQVAELAFENGLQVSPSIAKSLLPTPTVFHVRMHDEPIEVFLERERKSSTGQIGKSTGVALRMEMMPTPVASEGFKAPAQQDAETKGKTGQVWLSNVAKSISNENGMNLLPTVQVDDSKNTGHNQTRRTTLASEVWLAESTTNWGKFEPAIRRWEALTRPAPAPTKPDGKDGNHRLSAEFTEWMMGLPAGWVTAEDLGLKRNDQLKACGNGVVPQQAELALRILLQGLPFESELRGGQEHVLPTPTVMDQRDGKYLRAVAIKNLDKGANRGLNLNNVVEAIGVDWVDGDTFEMVDGKLVKRVQNG